MCLQVHLGSYHCVFMRCLLQTVEKRKKTDIVIFNSSQTPWNCFLTWGKPTPWKSVGLYNKLVWLHHWANPNNAGKAACERQQHFFITTVVFCEGVSFAVIAHTLALKMWQKKNDHLLLHSLACTGKKSLPGTLSVLKTYLSQALQTVLLCWGKQPLEGNSGNSWLWLAGNFTRKYRSPGNNGCLPEWGCSGKQRDETLAGPEAEPQQVGARCAGPTGPCPTRGCPSCWWQVLRVRSGRPCLLAGLALLAQPLMPGQEGLLWGNPATPGHQRGSARSLLWRQSCWLLDFTSKTILFSQNNPGPPFPGFYF